MTFDEAIEKKKEYEPLEEMETDHGPIDLFLMIAPLDDDDFKEFKNWHFRNWPAYQDTDAMEFAKDSKFRVIRFWANHHIGMLYTKTLFPKVNE